MPEPELSATFPFSNADLADVHLRGLLRDPGLRRRRWQTAIALGVFGLVIASLLLVLLPTESAAMRWGLLIASALTPIVVFLWRWPTTTRRALHHWVQQQFGDGPYTCTVTLLPMGVRWEQMGESFEDPWRSITRIRRSGEDIEFTATQGGVVRRRAFASDDERDRFLAAAQRLHADAVSAAT